MAGVAFSLFGVEVASANEFLPDGNSLRYVRHPKIRPDTNNPG